MAEKYIRVSNYLHEKLKIKAAELHMTLRDLAGSYIWQILRKDEKVIPSNIKTYILPPKKQSTGQKDQKPL